MVVGWEVIRANDGSAGEVRARTDLTAREIEVLRLLVEGRSNAEIGKAQFVAASTYAADRPTRRAVGWAPSSSDRRDKAPCKPTRCRNAIMGAANRTTMTILSEPRRARIFCDDTARRRCWAWR